VLTNSREILRKRAPFHVESLNSLPRWTCYLIPFAPVCWEHLFVVGTI